MRSYLIQGAFAQFVKGQTRESLKVLGAAALLYHNANQQGQPQAIRAGYDRLLAQVRRGEQESGVQLIASPDGSYVCALTTLASHIYQAVNAQKQITFSSIEAANNWLWQNRGIVITDVDFHTGVSFGLFANHTKIHEVIISYRPIGGDPNTFYGICEDEQTKFFSRDKTEGYAAAWDQANPGYHCVLAKRYSNSRGSSSSQLFGFGLDYAEHIKHIVVYRSTVNHNG